MRSLAAFAVGVADQLSAATPWFLVVTPPTGFVERRRVLTNANHGGSR